MQGYLHCNRILRENFPGKPWLKFFLIAGMNAPGNSNNFFTHRRHYQEKNFTLWMMKENAVIKKLISCIVLLSLMGSLAGACYLAAESTGDLPKNPQDACWYCIDTCVGDHPRFQIPSGTSFAYLAARFRVTHRILFFNVALPEFRSPPRMTVIYLRPGWKGSVIT